MSVLYRTYIEDFLKTTDESKLRLLIQQSPGSTPEQHSAWSEQNIVLRNAFPKLIAENNCAQNWGLLLECRFKGIDVPTMETIANAPEKEEREADWEQ